MYQREGFEVEGEEDMVCRLRIFLCSLKLGSRYRFLKIQYIVTSFGFKENVVD